MSRKLVISLVTATALLMPALFAHAAVTIGSSLALTPDAADTCIPDAPCTAAMTAIPGRQVSSPERRCGAGRRLRRARRREPGPRRSGAV